MMQTKTALIITGLILVVLAATIATRAEPVYAPNGCASCGKLFALPHTLNTLKAETTSGEPLQVSALFSLVNDATLEAHTHECLSAITHPPPPPPGCPGASGCTSPPPPECSSSQMSK
jgi:hypothetical protein